MLVSINFPGLGWMLQAARDWLGTGRRACPKLHIWKCLLLPLLSLSKSGCVGYHCQREDVLHKSRRNVWFLLPKHALWNFLHTWQRKCSLPYFLLQKDSDSTLHWHVQRSVVKSDTLRTSGHNFQNKKPHRFGPWGEKRSSLMGTL